ncbi:hypothetical protein NHQ30_004752 [Ciborinia camelliae]|nr:hypothetical protein NHQ30_004752 [Ciborinia camelliae]
MNDGAAVKKSNPSEESPQTQTRTFTESAMQKLAKYKDQTEPIYASKRREQSLNRYYSIVSSAKASPSINRPSEKHPHRCFEYPPFSFTSEGVPKNEVKTETAIWKFYSECSEEDSYQHQRTESWKHQASKHKVTANTNEVQKLSDLLPESESRTKKSDS